MMDVVSPETCWASYKYEIKFRYTVESCWIFFVNCELTALHSLSDSNERQSSMHCVCGICNSNGGYIKFTDVLSMTPCSLIQVATFSKAFVVFISFFSLNNLIQIVWIVWSLQFTMFFWIVLSLVTSWLEANVICSPQISYHMKCQHRDHRGEVTVFETWETVVNVTPLYLRFWNLEWVEEILWKMCKSFNPLNVELNPICYLLALLGAHHFLHVSRIRVKSLTLKLLMSYIYIYIYYISSLRVNTSAHCSGRKQVKG